MATRTIAAAASELVSAVETTGLWTPGLTFGGGSTGMTFSVRQGSYVIIGGICHARCYFTLSAKGSSTGSAVITGLPVPSANVASQYAAASIRIGAGFASLSGAVQGYNAPNTSTVALWIQSTTGQATMNEANFTNTSDIMVSVSYPI